MKLSGEELEKLAGVLRKAYQRNDTFELGARWRNGVMVRIRQMGPHGSVPQYLPTLEHLVWRLAPATALLMVGLSVLSFSMNTFFEYDLYQLFLNTVEDSALAHLFGM